MGWLVFLGILTLLAILPLGVSICYDEDGAVVRLIAGPVKIKLFPRTKKDKEDKKEKAANQRPDQQNSPNANQQAQPTKTEEKKPAAKKGGPISDFLPLVRIVRDMLGAFRRRLRVNVLELKVVMAADDPCDLAVNYGRAWAAVGNLMPRLERVLVIKKRNVEVECDFETTKTLVTARLDLTITLGRLVVTVVVYAVKALVEFMKIKNKRKGGGSK